MENLNNIIACTLGIDFNDNYENTLHEVSFNTYEELELEDLFKDFN